MMLRLCDHCDAFVGEAVRCPHCGEVMLRVRRMPAWGRYTPLRWAPERFWSLWAKWVRRG